MDEISCNIKRAINIPHGNNYPLNLYEPLIRSMVNALYLLSEFSEANSEPMKKMKT